LTPGAQIPRGSTARSASGILGAVTCAAVRQCVCRTAVVALALVIVGSTACSSATQRAHTTNTSSGPAAVQAPQLPARVLADLRRAAATDPYGKVRSADWVLTTDGKAATVFGDGLTTATTPVYVFDLHGHFVWNHSCPAGASPAACISRGTDEVYTFDPKRIQTLGFTVRGPVNLVPLGRVGHLTFGLPTANT
jgi:hypothetical protein